MPDDYELLYLAQEKNEDAIDTLLKKYYNKIWYKSAKECSKFRDIDDYINEGLLCFYQTIDNYIDNTKFSTYLNKTLDNRLINYKKQLERKKHSVLNNAILIDSYEEINDKSLMDYKSDPILIIEEEDNYKTLRKKIIDVLTAEEELVLSLIEQNFTIKEISNITDNKTKKIYNTIRNMRLKVSKII